MLGVLIIIALAALVFVVGFVIGRQTRPLSLPLEVEAESPPDEHELDLWEEYRAAKAELGVDVSGVSPEAFAARLRRARRRWAEAPFHVLRRGDDVLLSPVLAVDEERRE